MQSENEILMCTYSYLHSRVFPTIIYFAVYAVHSLLHD